MTKTPATNIDSLIEAVCDTMRSGDDTAGASNYIPELTWLLFLRMLDETEAELEKRRKATRRKFSPLLEEPFRWRDWAAKGGKKRQQLSEKGTGDAFPKFVNSKLFPYLKKLGGKDIASERQKVVSQVFASLGGTKFNKDRNMLDVLNKLDDLQQGSIDDTHIFPLSKVYEDLLLKMGDRNSDLGQFFTPREVIRMMVQTIDPKIGEKVYDPCCGTGGFLAQSHQYMLSQSGDNLSARDLKILTNSTFYGREKGGQAHSIALANLVLHGIDVPHLWHTNTLETDRMEARQKGEPTFYDVILTNPPFGGKEVRGVGIRFRYPSSKTQILFLQEVIDSLKQGGRCGLVIDEGSLFNVNKAFKKTRARLLEKCSLWCIVSLPPGVFTQANARGVKTYILFFTEGKPTKSVWYYDLSHVNVGITNPLTLQHFDEFFKLLPKREDSENSWTVDIETIKADNYNLKAINPHRKREVDERTPAQLLTSIEEKQAAITKALKTLRRSL